MANAAYTLGAARAKYPIGNAAIAFYIWKILAAALAS